MPTRHGQRKILRRARKNLAPILTNPQAPPHYRSYAHLRIAQSYVAEGKAAEAKTEYQKIAATADYPQVHRDEAKELAGELERAAKGLPPRDPNASRVHLASTSSQWADAFHLRRAKWKRHGRWQRKTAVCHAAKSARRSAGIARQRLYRNRAGTGRI